MALNLSKFSKQLFTQLSASAADAADTNTKFKARQRIPKLLKEANWFDQNKVDATRIVKQGSLFYVPIAKKDFKSMTVEFIDSNFLPHVATQLSASFNAQFPLSGLPEDVVILSEDGPAATASYEHDKVSGIGSFITTITNSSTAAGGATWSFSGNAGQEIRQNEFTSSYEVRYAISASGAAAFSRENNTNPSSASGSKISDTNTSININGVDGADGSYFRMFIKGKIFGDGDETQFASEFSNPESTIFLPGKDVYVFKSTIKVASGSFFYKEGDYIASNGKLAVSNRDQRTIYWPYGTSVGSLPYSGSLIQSGTLFYSDSDLTVAADSGWYYPTGATGLGDYNNTTDLLFRVNKKNTEQVPRIYKTDNITQI